MGDLITHFVCPTCNGERERGHTDYGQQKLNKFELLRYVGDQDFYCCVCGAYTVPDLVFRVQVGAIGRIWCRDKHDTEPPEDWGDD